MKRTRWISALLALIFVLGAFSSCTSGGEGTATTDAGSTAEAPTEVPTENVTEAQTTAGGYVVGSPEDQFYNHYYGVGKVKDPINAGVMGLISCCEYYNDTMKASSKTGKKWVYSNSSTYVPQKGYFDDMVKSGKTGANCASPVNWAFIDMGIMPSSLRFYGGSSGEFANYGAVALFVEPICDITDYTGKGLQFKDLYQQGKVKAGDIFLCKHHTFIYRGDGTFYAAGHDGAWHTDNSASTEDERKAVFDNWILSFAQCSDYEYTIYFQLRIKDEFVPKYFRDETGAVVENPLFDPENTLIYDYSKGYSYDTSGRENVLIDTKFSKSNGFNLSKLSDAARLTDGQLYYDNTTLTYCDCQMSGGAGYASAPTYWFDANGKQSAVKDETHKYLCGFWVALDEVSRVDSFSIYSQAVGASSGTPIGDIDGFDILVSTDGKNWTVAYSITEASCKDKWQKITDEKNINAKGNAMGHYLDAKFTSGAVEAKYIMFALTECRCIHEAAAVKYGYSTLTSSANYFRISEIQVYSAK